MFAENLTPEVLRRVLLPRDQFHPFPDMRDRAYWTALPDAVRQGLVSAGEAAMASPWPALPATLYLDFSRTGARTPYELTYFARRAALCSMVLAECVEGAGRFLDAIVNALWSICEESTWVIPAHCGLQKADSRLPDTSEPVVDLFAGETGALVSWTRYLLGSALDAISPLIAPRLASEVQRRVILPCLSRDDFWWMAGASGRASNWTVWTCSNWLTCVLLDEPDPERRVQAAAKIAGCLNRYADAVPQDGGCDEGPHYWSYAAASLVDALDLLAAATQGKLSFYDQPIVRDMVRYIAYAHICDRYFVNFADGPGVLQVDPFLLHRCGRRVQDKDVMSLAASLAAPGQAPSGGLFGTLGRVLWSLQEQPLIAAHASAPLLRDVWLPETQVAAARQTAGSPKGLYFAAKGGHNAERHNHNDVGNVIVYADGAPVLIDAGVGTYTRRTFGPDRYSIWTMQSAWHNLPTINGHMQQPGREFAACEASWSADDERAVFQLDIAPAYPAQAGLVSWVRRITLLRGRCIEIAERCEFLATPSEVLLHLLTPCAVVQGPPGLIALEPAPLADGRVSGQARIEYPADRFDVSLDEQPLDDGQLAKAWGARLTRVTLALRACAARDGWVIRVTPAQA